MPSVKQPATSQQALLEIQMLPFTLTFTSMKGPQFEYFTPISSLKKVASTLNISYDSSKKWHSLYF